MSGGSQRERAETAFGHLQHAASEMIAAVHDTLDMIDDVVTKADLGEILDTVEDLRGSFWKKAASRSTPRPAPVPATDGAGARSRRPDSTVQRISVR